MLEKEIEKINQSKRGFFTEYLPKGTLAAYSIKAGLVATVFGVLLGCVSTPKHPNEIVKNAPFNNLADEIHDVVKSGEMEERDKLRDARKAEGQKIPKMEYKGFQLMGSLRMYESEPTNDEFILTLKQTIDNFPNAPKCYEAICEFEKRYKKREKYVVVQKLIYRPELTRNTSFQHYKTGQRVSIPRSLLEARFGVINIPYITATMCHELIAHGYQAVENRSKKMDVWEIELEGYAIELYAAEEMGNLKALERVKRKMNRMSGTFRQWRQIGVKNIYNMQAKDMVRKFLAHCEVKYEGEYWVKHTYLRKFMD